jgi:hypothetical protein
MCYITGYDVREFCIEPDEEIDGVKEWTRIYGEEAGWNSVYYEY